MGRGMNAEEGLAEAVTAVSFPPTSEPGSGIHARIAERVSVESFSAWVKEQVVDPFASRDELEAIEELLLCALQAREIPVALMHACALVYLDPEHELGLRIKKRCAREMQRELARGDHVPRMRLRWSDLRDRTLSPPQVALLSCIDGRATVDEVLGLTGLPLAVAREALAALAKDGIVSTEGLDR
jgi:hypothetical protein